MKLSLFTLSAFTVAVQADGEAGCVSEIAPIKSMCSDELSGNPEEVWEHSGTCESESFHSIHNIDACEAAAKARGYTWEGESNDPTKPKGCWAVVQQGSGTGHFNTEGVTANTDEKLLCSSSPILVSCEADGSVNPDCEMMKMTWDNDALTFTNAHLYKDSTKLKTIHIATSATSTGPITESNLADLMADMPLVDTLCLNDFPTFKAVPSTIKRLEMNGENRTLSAVSDGAFASNALTTIHLYKQANDVLGNDAFASTPNLANLVMIGSGEKAVPPVPTNPIFMEVDCALTCQCELDVCTLPVSLSLAADSHECVSHNYGQTTVSVASEILITSAPTASPTGTPTVAPTFAPTTSPTAMPTVVGAMGGGEGEEAGGHKGPKKGGGVMPDYTVEYVLGIGFLILFISLIILGCNKRLMTHKSNPSVAPAQMIVDTPPEDPSLKISIAPVVPVNTCDKSAVFVSYKRTEESTYVESFCSLVASGESPIEITHHLTRVLKVESTEVFHACRVFVPFVDVTETIKPIMTFEEQTRQDMLFDWHMARVKYERNEIAIIPVRIGKRPQDLTFLCDKPLSSNPTLVARFEAQGLSVQDVGHYSTRSTVEMILSQNSLGLSRLRRVKSKTVTKMSKRVMRVITCAEEGENDSSSSASDSKSDKSDLDK